MAAHGWRSGRSVIAWLRSEPFRFDFYQALRHLELLRPDAAPVGEKANPRAEAVAFKAEVKQSFPASEISDLTSVGEGEDARRHHDVMTVTFMGLAGAMGPLPPPFTERIIERVRARDFAARDFLDIFNHRLISLMARMRRRHRPELVPQAPWQSPAARMLQALIGIETPGLQGRLGVPDRSLLHHAGLLASSRRSQHGLETLLSDFLGVRVRAAPFQGGWLTLDSGETTTLGRRNNRLGDSAVLGTRIWDQQAGIKLTIGPLSLTQFLQCLPSGVAYPRIAALAGFYTRNEVALTTRLCLKATEIPGTVVGTSRAARLGWTSWLRTKPSALDDHQVRLIYPLVDGNRP